MNHLELLDRQAAMLFRRVSVYYGDNMYFMSITRRERTKHLKERAYQRWCRRSQALKGG